MKIFLIYNCSFDNKSGIWTGSNQIVKKKDNITQNAEYIFKKQNNIVEEIDLTTKQIIKIDNLKKLVDFLFQMLRQWRYKHQKMILQGRSIYLLMADH